MAYSFISYRDENIRVNDFDLIALVFLLKATARQKYGESSLNDVFAAWIDSIENDGAGNIDLNLDSLLTSPEQLALLLNILHSVKLQLAEFPEVIAADFLRQLILVKGVEFGNYKKIFLENITNALDQLLRSVGY